MTVVQEYPDLDWTCQAEPSWSLRQIRDEFCTQHHLNDRTFCLYSNDTVLSVNLLVSEVGRQAGGPTVIAAEPHSTTAAAV